MVSLPLIRRNKDLKYPLELVENQVRNRNINAFTLLEGKEFPNQISFVETWLPKALNEMQRMSHCMWCARSGSLPGQSLPKTSKAKLSCQISNVSWEKGGSWLQRVQWGSLSSFTSKSAWVSSLDMLLPQITRVQDQHLLVLEAILILSPGKVHLRFSTRGQIDTPRKMKHMETGDHLGRSGMWYPHACGVQKQTKGPSMEDGFQVYAIHVLSPKCSLSFKLVNSKGFPSPIPLVFMIALFLPVFWLISSYVAIKREIASEIHSHFQTASLWFWGSAKLCSAPGCRLDVWPHDDFTDFLQWHLLAAFSCSLTPTNSSQCFGTGTQTTWHNCPSPPLFLNIFSGGIVSSCLF